MHKKLSLSNNMLATKPSVYSLHTKASEKHSEKNKTMRSKFSNILNRNSRFRTETSEEETSNFHLRNSKHSQKREHQIILETIQQYKLDLQEVLNQKLSPSSKDYLSNNRVVLGQIFDLLEKMLVLRHERTEVIRMAAEITSLSAQLRNTHLKIQLYLLFGKLSKYYKLNQQAILWAKMAKRFSDHEDLLHHKMRAYKLLGQCFLRLKKSHQAQVYITKYLICSWKLGLTNDELKAYEFLGKFYYYEGELERAKIFHQRMMNGNNLVREKFYQNPNSHVRQLGIARLMQGSVGRSRNRPTLESDYQNITSDDEPFNVIFNLDEDKPIQKAQQFISELIENQKKSSVLKHPIRKMPLFDSLNPNTIQEQMRLANLRIRPRLKENFTSLTGQDGILDFKNLQGHTRKLAKLGELRNFIFLNHMSPNRTLASYQFQELNKGGGMMNKKIDELAPYFEANELRAIGKNIQRKLWYIHSLAQWVDERLQLDFR